MIRAAQVCRARRRLSKVNVTMPLYGMGFQNYDGGTTEPVYRPGADAAIRPSIPRPPSTGRDPCTCIGARCGQCLCKLSVRASLSGATIRALVP